MSVAARAAMAALKEARRRNVIADWKGGMNNCENGRKNGGINESTVRSIIKRWGHLPPSHGELLEAPRSGRPRAYRFRCTYHVLDSPCQPPYVTLQVQTCCGSATKETPLLGRKKSYKPPIAICFKHCKTGLQELGFR